MRCLFKTLILMIVITSCKKTIKPIKGEKQIGDIKIGVVLKNSKKLNDTLLMEEYIVKFTYTKGSKEFIRAIAGKNPEAQDNIFKYFSTAAQQDFYQITSSDTLQPVFYHFERNYGTMPENNMILCFEKNRKKEDSDSNIFVFDGTRLGLDIFKINLTK